MEDAIERYKKKTYQRYVLCLRKTDHSDVIDLIQKEMQDSDIGVTQAVVNLIRKKNTL